MSAESKNCLGKDRIGLGAPKRIIVITTRRVGDVLLTTPLLQSLHLAWPNAEIDALVFEKTEGALSNNPNVNKVIVVPERPGFRAHLRFIAKLYRQYDLAISTMTGDRPTLYAWLAGRTRVGMRENSGKQRWKQSLLSDSVIFDNLDTHTVLMNLELADLLGINRSHEVVVSWNSSDEDAVTRILPFDIRVEAFAILHVYPKFPYKMWQQDRWAQLANWLVNKNIRVVLTGSGFPEELAYINQVASLMPQCTVNMAGKLSLAQCAFLVSRAKYYVGPDTALTHMAAALGIPTVALYGPSNPVKWGPWPKGYSEDHNPYHMKGSQRVGNVMLLQGDGECVPCMQEGCDRHIASLSKCLQDITVDRVTAALKELAGEA